MRKTFVFLMFIIVLTSFTFAETSSSSINWASHRYVNENFCALNAPSCIFLGNMTFLGGVFNLTVTNIYINATTIIGLNATIEALGNDTYLRLDGQNTPTDNIEWGGFNLVDVGNLQTNSIETDNYNA